MEIGNLLLLYFIVIEDHILLLNRDISYYYLVIEVKHWGTPIAIYRQEITHNFLLLNTLVIEVKQCKSPITK